MRTNPKIQGISERMQWLALGLGNEALALAADLLNAIEAVQAVLAPVADHDNEAGAAAGVAFQILADAIVSAKPPEPAKP